MENDMETTTQGSGFRSYMWICEFIEKEAPWNSEEYLMRLRVYLDPTM